MKKRVLQAAALGALAVSPVTARGQAKNAALPDAPVSHAATQQNPKPNALEQHIQHISDEVEHWEDKTRVTLEVTPYDAALEITLKKDHADQPGSSLDLAGLTSSRGKGGPRGWGADLAGRQTFGNGPLNPAQGTRSYGGEMHARTSGTWGPVSAEGWAKSFAGEERFKVHLSDGQVASQLVSQGVPPGDMPQAAESLTRQLPTTNQTRVTGMVSGYAGADPKVTYVTKGTLEAGLTEIGGGGDMEYGSLGHGNQAEICATGAKFGHSIAASVCEVAGHASGYDNTQVHRGLRLNVAVKPEGLLEDLGTLRHSIGHHSARALAVKEEEKGRSGK